jgi:iron complex outermembrane recepter protein
MKILIFSFFILFSSISIFAQVELKGRVTNSQGESLIYATVFLENTTFAVATDEKGFFSLENIPVGNYSLKVSYVGYRSKVLSVDIRETTFIDVVLDGTVYDLDKIEIRASRVQAGNPFTFVNMDRNTILKENLGVDVPVLLQWTPSLVMTSDAGAGIGYTGMRIRGSDQTRLNVTINGVPLNDAESQDVFWVDLPDLASSVQNIQIQRGVGPSTNGPGAFGGTISVNTHQNYVNPYAIISGSAGSFDTKRMNVLLGTGLLNNKYSLDARYSLVQSDGYIDRAAAKLNSWYFSAARLTEKSSLRLNVFSGTERTYQAWNGVPEAKVKGDQEALLNHYYNNLGSIYNTVEDSVNLFQSDRRYNYYTYQDQVDDYTQTHMQLHHALRLSKEMSWNTTIYYTKGSGYFEQFKFNDKLSRYNIPDFVSDNGDIFSRTDIVRRRWLDNDLIGFTSDFTVQEIYRGQLQGGISGAKYIGDHFGNIISNGLSLPIHPDLRYYDNTGRKTDFSAYIRHSTTFGNGFSSFADLQLRSVNYDVAGVDNDLRNVDLEESFLFFNPKFGLNFQSSPNTQWYISYAVGQREPARSDFLDNAFGSLPKSEFLGNTELGLKKVFKDGYVNTNLYYMHYKDQLVLTGALNDVGASLRTNVPDSYRLGLEMEAYKKIHSRFHAALNFTFSRNKIKTFNEVIYDYTQGEDLVEVSHSDTDISFSPSYTGMIQLIYLPVNKMEIQLSGKFVGKQFLDNTSNSERMLDAYQYQNLRIAYQLNMKGFPDMDLTLLVNNITNRLYSSNGYSYSYIYENMITENFLYPQAGRNWMVGISVKF